MKKFKFAQGHVEVIISFVIFVSAIFFILVYINPINKSSVKVDYLDNTINKIIKNVSDKVGKISAISNKTSCNIVTDPGCCYDISVNDYFNDAKLVEVQDLSYEKKYDLYMSKSFPNDLTPNKNDNCKLYNLGAYIEENMIFYEKLKYLKETYKLDYYKLKLQLGLDSDFSFTAEDMLGQNIEDFNATRKIPGIVQVYSKDIPLNVIDYSGHLTSIKFKIKTW